MVFVCWNARIRLVHVGLFSATMEMLYDVNFKYVDDDAKVGGDFDLD